jgi:hypothetical protein
MDSTMKARCLMLLAVAAMLFAPPPGEGQDELLRVEASVVPRRLSRGEEGSVVLKLGVEAGITVSPHPEFIVEFKPCEELIFPKNFFTATDLGVGTLEEDGQQNLSFDKPLKIPLTVSPKAKKGSYILEGRIKYCARSAAEGWCVKNTAKFYAAYSTRSAAVAKKT